VNWHVIAAVHGPTLTRIAELQRVPVGTYDRELDARGRKMSTRDLAKAEARSAIKLRAGALHDLAIARVGRRALTRTPFATLGPAGRDDLIRRLVAGRVPGGIMVEAAGVSARTASRVARSRTNAA